MPDIPTRLLVISARVPEGERCDGCQYESDRYGDSEPICTDPHLDIDDDRDRLVGTEDGSKRLPACRERDGWACYPPDSGVAELVEAAKVTGGALNNDWRLLQIFDRGMEETRDEAAFNSDCDTTPKTGGAELIRAARKVAKESNNVPRD